MTSLQWKGASEKRFAMQSPSQSQVGSPMFRLDLKSTIGEQAALSFPDPPKNKKKPSIATSLADQLSSTDILSPLSTLRFIAITQGFVIVILILLVCGLLYWSHRLNNNVNYYYAAAEPYVQQAMQHGLSMFTHADNSSLALENVMHGAELMTSTSIPALMDAVNRSVGMVARMEQVARNPTLKLSLG